MVETEEIFCICSELEEAILKEIERLKTEGVSHREIREFVQGMEHGQWTLCNCEAGRRNETLI